ncbi:MAG TPA: hypothetical protein VJ046_00185 [Candidatus Paceibacterota bacterium]|nr:hypothetical protein [Candidatus Paceibacterota bacterium]
MDRETFDRILTEEGVDDAKMRDDIWNTRPASGLNEENLRNAAKQFKRALPGLQVRKSLNDAMAREYGWDK